MINVLKNFWHDVITIRESRDSRFSVAQMLFVLAISFSWLGEGAMRFPSLLALLLISRDKQFPKIEIEWKSLQGITLAILSSSLFLLFSLPLLFGVGKFFDELSYLVRPAEILMFTFATLIFAKDEKFEKRAIVSLFFSLSILSILLFIDRATKNFPDIRTNWFFCDHCAFTGMYVCNMLSVLIYKILSKDSKWATRLGAFFIWLVTMAVCLVTYCRSVYLEFSAISIFAYVLAYLYLPRNNAIRRKIAIALLVTAIVVPKLIFNLVPQSSKLELIDNYQSTFSHGAPDMDRLSTSRNRIWKATLQKIKERPLVGYGFVEKFATMTKCYILSDRGWRYAPHAHNSFLHMCIRVGLPAACLFVLAHLLMLVLALKGLKKEENQALCFIVANMIVLRFVAGLTENFFMPGRFYLVQFWCLTVAMLSPYYKKNELPKRDNSCLVSVIVPAYNTAKYIRNSIQSVFDAMEGETFKFEVIVTNDGSTDNTKTVLEPFSAYNNFILINQENKGVSSARNAAVERASGKYLFFLDSDDTIVKEGFVKCLEYLVQYPYVDVLYFDIQLIDEVTHKKKYSKIFTPISHSGQELLASIFEQGSNYNRFFLCPKFCLRTLITENNIAFDENVHFSEDRLWTLDVLYYASNVRALNELTINVLDNRATSSCATPNREKRMKSAIAFIEHAKKLSALPSCYNPNYQKTLNCFIARMALWLCNFVRDQNGAWDEFATNYAERTLLEYGRFFKKFNRRFGYVWYIKKFGIKKFVSYYAKK
ncbi:MAG: glycosyltransferase [Synergistaceae bacterium]|nr:glycosyltransferase [Synergistaceae bacterium]